MIRTCHILLLLFVLSQLAPIHAQQRVYDINLKKEVKVLGLGVALNTAGYILLNRADRANIEDINQLDPSNLNGLDNSAVDNFSESAERFSDVILYTAATFPFVAYSFKKCRNEEWGIFLMGIETFLLTSGITTITKSIAKRYRPYNYNPDVDLDFKLGSTSRLSFFSGHASNTAAMCFFLAQVMTDIHPDMQRKYLLWTGAAVTPLAIGYLRYLAGKHFPTDILTGYAVGATIGYFIPKIHLNKNINITPLGTGISMRVSLDTQ